MTTDHHVATSNFPFFKKGVHGLRFSLQNVKAFFCLDLRIATHAKTGRRNDFKEYRSKILFLDNTQNRNSQTVSFAEILFLHCNGMCLWPLDNGRPSSFTNWIIIIVIIMICDPYFSWYAETGKIVTRPLWLV